MRAGACTQSHTLSHVVPCTRRSSISNLEAVPPPCVALIAPSTAMLPTTPTNFPVPSDVRAALPWRR